MARTKYTWGELDKVAKDFGLKMPKAKAKDAPDKEARKAKFAKCRVCGGQMTYVPGTNVLVCDNMVEKEFTKVGEDGKEVKSTKTVRCATLNLVKDEYQSYMNYLFA